MTVLPLSTVRYVAFIATMFLSLSPVGSTRGDAQQGGPQLKIPRRSAHNRLNPEHKSIVDTWLARQGRLRIATEDDCGRFVVMNGTRPYEGACKDQITMVRKGNPRYDPYYAVGDFNNDQHMDFAVVVVDPNRLVGDSGYGDAAAAVVVFNGPFLANTRREPATVVTDQFLSQSALFYGPPRPAPHFLVVGPFESEGWRLQPNGKTYIKR